jgi:hypothetical protein
MDDFVVLKLQNAEICHKRNMRWYHAIKTVVRRVQALDTGKLREAIERAETNHFQIEI